MSVATICAVADAAVAELNLGTQPWAGQFTAQRLFLPIYDLDTLETLQVVVVPRFRPENATFTRGPTGGQAYKRKQRHRIDIFVEQKFLGPVTNTLVDPLMLLTEQIEGWFLNDQHQLATFLPAACVESEINPWPSLGDLDEDGLFIAVIQAIFEVIQ